MTPTTPITSVSTAPSASNALAKLSGDYTLFLKLLTSQMTNQDPLDPMDTSQYTQQLVQYSQVEQSIQQSGTLKDILARLSSQDMIQASSLIGRAVSFDGSTAGLTSAAPARWTWTTAQRPTTLSATITDASGAVVDSRILDPASTSLDWDGMLPHGMRAPDGAYILALQALDAGGTSLPVTMSSRGTVSAVFVVALDPLSGAQLSVRQFGQVAQRTEAVRVSAAPGVASALGAMGLARGTLTPLNSPTLVAQTSLRAGDSFSVRLTGGAIRKIAITADDTLTSLADKVRKALGRTASVTTPTVDGMKRLRVEAKAGADVELIAGPEGTDALGKLGLAPTRLSVPEIAGKKDPKVKPGGTFGLALSDALSIATPKDAAVAVKQIKEAISTSQTAYRSLYWDDGKAALVNSYGGGGRVSAYQAKQVARYQDALTRISAITGSLGG
ncbi:flagellar hook assembly protein FlgD [Sphingobium subterraneum]|uniref:Basal-body rod modification protein FlgD n=1 Tax=Sphingobium subterraneum TaxID=627688 RepID=A0A841J3A0_9SPHN|nr:flagellar hook capping FlgD N-terminal domain-containing protein [Sphingobium subterraneum]MBB6122761.1 flagellar hook assembly protein FlgD [Sphingobium subterraneum]